MSIIRFFSLLFFMLSLAIACQEKDRMLKGGQGPGNTTEPNKETVKDQEKCGEIIDTYTACLENKIINVSPRPNLEEANSARSLCVENSTASMRDIQSGKMKDALQKVLTASGLGSGPLPSECAEKKRKEHQFVCLIRQEKQTVCSE